MRYSLIITNLVCAAIVIGVGIVPHLGRAEATSDPLVPKVAEYHVRINQEVNDHLTGFYSVLEQIQKSETKSFTPDLRKRFAQVAAGKCKSEETGRNLSVSCLKESIDLARLEILDPAINQARKQFIPTSTTGATDSGAEQQKADQINEIVSQANEASQQILDAYSQIVLTHILHTELKLTAARIESLNEVLADFESDLRWLPLKFVDISTTQCR